MTTLVVSQAVSVLSGLSDAYAMAVDILHETLVHEGSPQP